MRKLLILAVLLLGVSIVKADDVAFDFGEIKLMVPLKVVSGTQLYSFEEGRGYPAIETVLAKRSNFQLTFGAAAVLGTSTNVPFAGIQTKLSPILFDTSNNDLYFGVWAGKPSNDSEWLYGLKASVELW